MARALSDAEIETTIRITLYRFHQDRDFDDLCQEARIAVWQQLKPHDRRGLVVVIARRKAFDYLRKRDGQPMRPKPVPLHSLDLSSPYTPDEEYEWLEKHESAVLPDFAPELIDQLWVNELFNWLKSHTKGNIARALRLRYWQSCSLEEVSTQLGVSYTRAHQLVQQGLNRLRANLGLPELGHGPARDRRRAAATYARRKAAKE